MTSRITRHREIIEDGLSRNKQPDLSTLTKDLRSNGLAWATVADEVEQRSGWSVGTQTLINWFPQYNKPAAELAEAKS